MTLVWNGDLVDRELSEDGEEEWPGYYAPPKPSPIKENKVSNKKRKPRKISKISQGKGEENEIPLSIPNKSPSVKKSKMVVVKEDPPRLPALKRKKRVVRKRRPHPTSGQLSELSELSSSKGLLTGEVPKTEWLVENLLGTGFLTIAGAPKSGKTLLALQLASTVITGGTFLSHSVRQRDVLFIQLEMARGTMKQYALKQGLPGAEEIEFVWNNKDTREYLTKENILKEVEEFIEGTKGTGLVLIDSLSKLDPCLDHNDVRAINPLYGSLQDMVRDTKASILLIDHANKSIHRSDSNPQGAIGGSTHKSARTDGYMVLRKRTIETDRSLFIDGYFPSKSSVIRLDTSTLLWSLVGEENKVTLQEKYIIEIEAIKKLKENATHKEIVRETGYTKGYVSRRLKDAISDGVIHLEEKIYKVY